MRYDRKPQLANISAIRTSTDFDEVKQYKNRSGQFVSQQEACFNGTLRDGYSVVVPMLMTDNAARLNLSDAERLFADSAEGRQAVSWARHKHDLSEAYKGLLAIPFSAHDEQRALQEAFAEKQVMDADRARWAADAERLSDQAQVLRDVAEHRLRNGWRN